MGLGEVFKSLREGQSQVSKGEFFESIERAVDEEIEIIEPLDYWDKVRSSSLPYFCPREEMIRHYIGFPWGSKVDWAKRWVMDRGTAIHYAYQNLVLPSVHAIDGRWTCLDCGAAFPQPVYQGKTRFPRPDKCDNCEGDSFIYDEEVMDDPLLLLTGHADGLWMEKKAVWEFKTCGKNTYRKVVNSGPLEAHRVQAGAYLSMLQRKGFAVDNVRFLYVPMEDVCDVSIPAPGVREPFYEVDPITKAILCVLPEKDVMPYFNEAFERVMLFRTMLKSNQSQERMLLPEKHRTCTSESRGGQWKWGCDLCHECFAMGREYDDEKVEWLTVNGDIDSRKAPEGVVLGGGPISLVGVKIEDPDGLIGEPGGRYTVKEGWQDEDV